MYLLIRTYRLYDSEEIDAMQKKHHDKAYLKMRKAMAIPTAVAMSPSMTSHLGRFKAEKENICISS